MTSAACDTIIIKSIKSSGRHGVFDWERRRAQPFEVDLEITTNLAPSGASDRLADTIDYSDIVTAVSGVVSERSFSLIEALAQEISTVVLSNAMAVGVVVTVRKMKAPVGVEVDYVAVRIARSRT